MYWELVNAATLKDSRLHALQEKMWNILVKKSL